MVGFRGLFSCLVLLVSVIEEAETKTRVYYIGIREKDWDYAPTGKNLINGKNIEDDEHPSVFLEKGPHRIGRVYKKAMYRQYTDATYTIEAPRPPWLGFLGPILKGEVGDVLMVHLKNFASRNYSIHPHGVFYEKNSEGALYPDGTSGRLKQDDGVSPGGNHTYRWEVRPDYAPTVGDANCLTWVYHSHLEAPREVSSGLIGAMFTCKKGILKDSDSLGSVQTNPGLERIDVDQLVFLMFTVTDESMSWYQQENIRTFCSDPDGVDQEDPDFQESNMMHAINGYMFGNLPGIELCQYRPVAVHLFGMGNEVDIHSVNFQGGTLLDHGHRGDTVSLFPATFVTTEMVPMTTGKWLLSCQVNDHLLAGMQAFYQVKSCETGDKPPVVPPSGQVRTYYVAAELVEWNYAPSGMDKMNNISLVDSESPSEMFFGKTEGRFGGSYLKVVYRAYIDDTFSTRKPATPESVHLGLLGPVLRAEVGDTLRVTFMNKADRNYSIQPHGLQYEKRFQGSSYQDGVEKPGSQVLPGQNFTYSWQVLEGPSPSDPPCIPYLYYSACDLTKDTNSGLVGPLLVCKKGTLGETGTQKEVDKEMFLMFSIMDEDLSWYFEANIKAHGSNETDPENWKFIESNKMHAVNGLMYGNLPGLDLCTGDKVVWYNLGLGTEKDLHGVYFQGNTFQRQGTTSDTLSVFPHTTATVTMNTKNPGVYEVNCKVTDHYMAGMRLQYTVKDCPERNVTRAPAQTNPTAVVKYFISAEEVEWDYSPSRSWELEKHQSTMENSPGNIYLDRGERRIGPRYKKVVYREYTDDTFRTQKERQADQAHLGILGPIIRAEVGERILITFKNKASRPYSIHAHGIETSDKHTPVQPGFMTEFRWDVPEQSGPGVSDPNCINYIYHSSVDYIKDMFSGLLGPLVVCRRRTLSGLGPAGEGGDRRRKDVQREFALLFLIIDENQSWYLEDNIRTYLKTDPNNFTSDASFEESNLMHGINGRLYGNLRNLTMTKGELVDWYLMGMGNEKDIHTVHFHAETFTYKMDRVHRADVFDLFPGIFRTIEMEAVNPGTWLLHCHVSDHIHAGMETIFTVRDNSSLASRSFGSIATLLLCLALGLIVS